MDAEHFIDRWGPSGGSERSNYQLFLTELCDLIGVDHPDPAGDDNRLNDYVFERAITFDNGDGTTSTKFADLYKRSSFICETKQGVEKRDEQELFSAKAKAAKAKKRTGHGKRGTKAYDSTMRRAVGQAEQYARHLPVEEGRPPFLMVIDVGYRIELYSEFSQTGGAYIPFPDARSHRIKLADLADEAVREKLRLVWADPHQLDPSRRSAKVTRAIANALGKLAKALEREHPAEDVAQFLMRCLFTMFAEDVGLLKEKSFEELLKSIDDPQHFAPVMESLWRTMDTGGFSTDLRQTLRRFNGGLFSEQKALPLDRDQLDLMIEAAEAKWNDVEPAIFGTLLERALDPVERHKLGAHYTPRAYVERLVMPTVVEPLREEWDAARVAAITLAEEGDKKGAGDQLTTFHHRLCEVRVLDPACGSGNFLYVVLEHLKRIEGEVFDAYAELVGDRQTAFDLSHTVNPEQLLGIEINPRAAAIAELVLWIGYLQWHYRTRGKVDPPEPVIRDLHNIECRDAVLAYDAKEPVIDEATGEPVTIWDGRTTKPHPVTGLEVPDESARRPIYRYRGPKKADWPIVDFIVGNPPFIGKRGMRKSLGEGYVDALRATYSTLPESCDYVMYWWDSAAATCTQQSSARAGLISTNSIRQAFNRRVLEAYMTSDVPLRIAFAVPDHPWVDASDGADVRISMTVFEQDPGTGTLIDVADDGTLNASRKGMIQPNLQIGADVLSAKRLQSNTGLCAVGFQLNGKGFVLDEGSKTALSSAAIASAEQATLIHPLRNGRDLSQVSRNLHVIDADGLTENDLRTRFPAVYQWLHDRVKPERVHNREAYRRENWWLFGRRNSDLREAMTGLDVFFAAPVTSKHRFFVQLPSDWLVDSTSIAVASDDSFVLAVLNTRIHAVWALRAGSSLGVGNDPRYNKGSCFEAFPFPASGESNQQRIRELGDQLDAHRKARQAKHPKLTITGMYNVLEKLRVGEPLTDKEKTIHEQGLASVLRQIHDDLDAAVAEAYGWPVDLPDEEILERLVVLNHERAEEEKRGLIRWLRPEYQNPDGVTQKAANLSDGAGTKPAAKAKVKKQPWPKAMAEQAAAVQAGLATLAEPADEKALAKLFTRANKDRIAELLATLAAIGKARELDDGRYVAA